VSPEPYSFVPFSILAAVTPTEDGAVPAVISLLPSLPNSYLDNATRRRSIVHHPREGL
jgi:hypothetical protein